MSPPTPSREELLRERRERRRRQIRRRRITALAVLVALLGAGVGAALALSGGGAEPASAPATTQTVATATAEGPDAVPVADEPPPDGSLGARNVRLACTLLTREEIRAQFGGPVGRATPMWPYCKWTIGKDAWVAVWVGLKTPIERTRERSYVLEDVGGLGDDAFFGTDRYLYFGQHGVSYYVVFQKVAEYTEIRRDELIALARAILEKPLDAEPPETRGSERELVTAPTREEPLLVYFGGDSLSAGPQWAFFTEIEKTKLVRTHPEYQVGTGIVRSDYFDWRRHLRGVVQALRPDVVIFMSGANDGQDYIIDGVYHPVGSRVWRRTYRRDVSRIMDVLAADGRKVIWVGMPPMEDPDLNAGMAEVNRIVEAEAEKREAVSYVDTWALFSGPDGGYAFELPDENGTPEPVRLEDGIHLNVEGSLRLGRAIVEELARVTDTPELARPS